MLLYTAALKPSTTIGTLSAVFRSHADRHFHLKTLGGVDLPSGIAVNLRNISTRNRGVDGSPRSPRPKHGLPSTPLFLLLEQAIRVQRPTGKLKGTGRCEKIDFDDLPTLIQKT